MVEGEYCDIKSMSISERREKGRSKTRLKRMRYGDEGEQEA